MKKEIILIAIALLLLPALVSAEGSIKIDSIQNFTTPMIGGDTYTAKIKLTSHSYTDIPLQFRFEINTTIPIELSEFNLIAFIGDFNLTCTKTLESSYSMSWTCKNNTDYYIFNQGETRYLNLSLSLNIAASPQSNLNWALTIFVSDTIPPLIELVGPPNNSVIRSGITIDLNITDNVEVKNVYWSKSVLFTDDFSAGSGNWATDIGTWNVESGEYSASIGSGDAQSHINSLTITDAYIETKFKILTGTTGKEWIGIHARKTSPSDHYTTSGYIAYIRYNGEVGIYKAGFGNLASTTALYDPSAFNTFRFVLSGNVLKLMLNGIEILNTTDNTYTSGSVSLWSGWTSATHSHFDDVKISDAHIIAEPYDINTTGFPDGLTDIEVFAYDTSGNGNHSSFSFIFDNTPPRVENSTINKTIIQGQNETVMVDVVDESNMTTDKVLVEDYKEYKKFDFQPANGQLEENYTNITRTMLYNSSIGYGWLTSPADDRDRGSGSYPENLTRDFIFDSADRTFIVDLPNGKYIVTVLLGDMSYAHDLMNVYANSQLKLSGVNTSAGQIKWLDFFVSVDNSQLNITFNDTGGNIHWTCPGLIIKFYVKTYEMSHVPNQVGSTYTATIPYPSLGLHSIRYLANDTVGNLNDTVTDSYNVTLAPPPRVISILINPSVNNTYVKAGNINFTITMNEGMNNSIALTVKIINSTTYTIPPYPGLANGWLNSTTWIGNFTVTGSTGDGNYTMNISGGKDLAGNIMETNTSKWFIINTIQPKVISLIIFPSVNNTYVKANNVTFNITFNENMNITIPLNVTFGLSSPFTQRIVLGNWINSTLWFGNYSINSSTGDGWNTIRIAGGRDLGGNIMTPNISHKFLIDTKTPIVRNEKIPKMIYSTQNLTLMVDAFDLGVYGKLDKAVAEINATNNYTMSIAYTNYTFENPYGFINITTYYVIINNTSLSPGNHSVRFYVNDTAGNMNSTVTGSFFVNTTIKSTGGKIAFLCRGIPVWDSTASNWTCNYGIENQTIKWLRQQGWNVTVKRYNNWTEAELNSTNLIVCADQDYACNPAVNSLVWNQSKVYGKGFVEIPTALTARAAYRFGYLYTPSGLSTPNTTNVSIATADQITTGYSIIYPIFKSPKTIGGVMDSNLKPNSIDLANPGIIRPYSSLFKVDQSGAQGRYVYVGWFYGVSVYIPASPPYVPSFYWFYGWTPYDLNSNGEQLLIRSLNWAQCGNAMGCI
jgi:hypothetical protein